MSSVVQRHFDGGMKFFSLLFCILISTNASLHGQLVTTDPLFPSSDEPVTLIFDVLESVDGRAEGLVGLTNDVFMWSGAGSSQDGNAFEFQPEGQTLFNQPFEPGRMTFLGDNRWSITITPRSYFGVPNGTSIEKLGVLLKNANGSAQTEDFIVDIFDPAQLNLLVTSPESSLFYDLDEVVRINVITSIDADVTFEVNGTIQGNTQSGKEAFIDITVEELEYEVVVTAITDDQQASKAIRLLQRRSPIVADLPGGVSDGINVIDDNTVVFVLTAPEKSFVYSVGDFSNWQLSSTGFMNITPDGSQFWLQVENLTPQIEYAFQYWVYDNDENFVRVGDPYAELILDPNNDRFINESVFPDLKEYPEGAEEIVSIFEIDADKYIFQNTDFVRPDPEDLIIYELLVRDFDDTGSFQAVIDRMDYISNLGVNAIELMPIMEFSGNISWGYNTIYHQAVDKAYGTPDKLKELIDVAHGQGIAVILDIVFNHADFASPLVKMYFDQEAGDFGQPAEDNPWCNEIATHPFSVFADFDHDSELTREFIDRVNRFWLEEFKVDGFRYDLSKGFTQNVTSNVGDWNALDNSRVFNLTRMKNAVRAYDETAYLMLEHLGNDEEEVVLANEGFMLWGIMHNEYKNSSIASNDNSDLSRTFHLNRNGDWQEPAVIAYKESHDEQRIMYENLEFGNNSSAGHNVREFKNGLNRIKAASTILYSIPGPKLLWQFGELGYELPINLCSDGTTIDGNCRTDPKPVRRDYEEDEERLKLYNTLQALFNLKTSYPIFKTSDVQIIGGSNLFKQVVLKSEPFVVAPNSSDEMSVVVYANFDVTSRTVDVQFPHTGNWFNYFSNSELNVSNTSLPMTLRPGEFQIYTNVDIPEPLPELNPFVRPIAPEFISLSAIQGQGAQLTWIDNSEVEDGYRVFKSTNDGVFALLTTLPANTQEYLDTDIVIGANYTYEVVAFNNNGESASERLLISGDDIITSLEGNFIDNFSKVYPNPAYGSLTLLSKGSISTKLIELIALNGTIIKAKFQYKESSKQLEIDVNDVKNGLYYLRIITTEKTFITRVVIQN